MKRFVKLIFLICLFLACFVQAGNATCQLVDLRVVEDEERGFTYVIEEYAGSGCPNGAFVTRVTVYRSNETTIKG